MIFGLKAQKTIIDDFDKKSTHNLVKTLLLPVLLRRHLVFAFEDPGEMVR